MKVTRTEQQFIETVNFFDRNIPGSYIITVKRITSCLIEECQRNFNLKNVCK